MKKTLLKNIMYNNPPKPPIKESRVGDMYIEIGETIEQMEELQVKLAKLIHNSGMKQANAVSSDLRHQIVKLKNIFGDSYDFKP